MTIETLKKKWGRGTAAVFLAGALVFFDEAGYGISHVGIATGYGTMIHSSTYFGEITESSIYDVPGYVGAVDVSEALGFEVPGFEEDRLGDAGQRKRLYQKPGKRRA